MAYLPESDFAEPVTPSYDDLMLRAQAGDMEAAGEAWMRVQDLATDRVRSFGDASTVEDLTQEVALRFIGNVDKYEHGTNLEAWVTTIAFRIGVDHWRRKGSKQQQWSLDATIAETNETFADRLPDTTNPLPGETIESDQLIARALKVIPPQYRDYVRAMDIEGVRNTEYATTKNVHPTTVATRLHRGRAALRAALMNGAVDEEWQHIAQRYDASQKKT